MDCSPARTKKPGEWLETCPDFSWPLAGRKNRAPAEKFRSLAPTYQREYLVWLTFAKLPETRARRLKETLAALKAGRKWVQRKRA